MMLRFLSFCVALLYSTGLLAQIPPAPPNYTPVNDYGVMLHDAERERLKVTLQAFQDSASVQIAVVTVSDLGGLTIERFANELFNQWGIGQRSSNNGVLILVAREERQMRIEVGYGAEALLPDALCGQIIEEVLKPNFRANNYYEGLNEASNLIRARLRGQFEWQPGDGQYLGDLAYQALPLPRWYFPIWYVLLGGFFLYLPYYRTRKSVGKTVNSQQQGKKAKKKKKKQEQEAPIQIPNLGFYPSLVKNFLLLSLPGIIIIMFLPWRWVWACCLGTGLSFSLDRIHYELRWFKGWTAPNWLGLIFFRSWYMLMFIGLFSIMFALPIVLLEDFLSERLSDSLMEILFVVATWVYAYVIWLDPQAFHDKFMKTSGGGSGSYSSGGYSSYSSGSSSSSSSSWSSSSSSSSWGGGSSGGGGASGSW